MRNMGWDPLVWQALKDAVSPMPLFIRKKALTMIIKASEESARGRGASQVEEQDLVKAAMEKVSSLARGRMLAALAEQGIRIEALEEKVQGRKIAISHRDKSIHGDATVSDRH